MFRIFFFITFVVSCPFAASCFAQTMQFTRVATGLNRPVFGTFAPGETDKLFIVEARMPNTATPATGNVRILDLNTGVVNATPYLSIPNLSTGSEQGLLGLAFHPQYQANGLFYVNYTNSLGDTVVQEYQRQTATTANPATARQILTIDQPFSNHNGGWLGFGKDNRLYIASGDGGSANDPQGNGQSISDGNFLGKILRIDVDSDAYPADPTRNYGIPNTNPFASTAGEDAIWAYGLRNPWRPSFDSLTGDLYIADVGQNAFEEINVQPANSTGGENYGWDIREGNSGAPLAGAIDPIHDYPRSDGFSITGGYVYRGPSIPGLDGQYLFADYVSENIWSLDWNETNPALNDGTNFTGLTKWNKQTNVGTLNNIASFAEDANGNVYVFDIGASSTTPGLGELYRIDSVIAVPEPSSLGLLLAACTSCSLLVRRRAS